MYFGIRPTNPSRNVAPFQNLKCIRTTVTCVQSSALGVSGLNHLPSNPITHRAQARAVSVPQDA
jgi:hypothetical protein